MWPSTNYNPSGIYGQSPMYTTGMMPVQPSTQPPAYWSTYSVSTADQGVSAYMVAGGTSPAVGTPPAVGTSSAKKRKLTSTKPITRPRKQRVNFTEAHKQILEESFSQSPLPTPSQRSEIAARLNMNQKVITVWFQNRRAKEKRANKQRIDYPNIISSLTQPAPYGATSQQPPPFQRTSLEGGPILYRPDMRTPIPFGQPPQLPPYTQQ